MTFQKDVLSLITGCLKLLSLSDLVMDSVNALGTGKVSYLYHLCAKTNKQFVQQRQRAKAKLICGIND